MRVFVGNIRPSQETMAINAFGRHVADVAISEAYYRVDVDLRLDVPCLRAAGLTSLGEMVERIERALYDAFKPAATPTSDEALAEITGRRIRL